MFVNLKRIELVKKMFLGLSKRAVIKAVRQNDELSDMWSLSLKILPGLEDHFNSIELSEEENMRLRLLICSEALFLKNVITSLLQSGQKVGSCLDIGDSDGTTRLLLKESMDNFNISTLGINLQQQAVEKIRQRGLDAERIDAMELNKEGRKYDIVSVFETLEHLPNPIGFLENMHEIVNQRLVISVPLIVNSRVSLGYLDDNWPKSKVPTIENNHIFELAPRDWRRIMLHCGWEIEKEWKVRQFPDRGVLGQIMRYAWRKISFEGFWFVSLIKDMSSKNRFRIE